MNLKETKREAIEKGLNKSLTLTIFFTDADEEDVKKELHEFLIGATMGMAWHPLLLKK